MIQLIDFLSVVAAASVAFFLYVIPVLGAQKELDRYGLTAFLGAISFVLVFRRLGGYSFRRLSMLRWQLTSAAFAWLGVAVALLVLGFLAKVSAFYSRGWALGWTAATLTVLIVGRGLLHAAIRKWSMHGRLTRNIVIIGAGDTGQRLIEKLRAAPNGGYSIVGVFDDRASRVPPTVAGSTVLGTTDDLLEFARRVRIDEIIIALPLAAAGRFKVLIEKLKSLPVDIRLSVEPLAHALPVRGWGFEGGVPVLDLVERPLKRWNGVMKWAEDKVLAALLLVVLLPMFMIIALVIKLDSPGPVFFTQERFGFNNRVIRVLKFRTMYVDRSDPSGEQRTVRNDPRVTRVGYILRSFSLDELPQLINVLKGEMSVVGPRAHAVAMKAGGLLYHDAVAEYVQRHRVKPGITGWAQVNGLRGEIDSEEKARQRVIYDLKYIDDWSLWLDFTIILMSMPVLLRRQNAY